MTSSFLTTRWSLVARAGAWRAEEDAPREVREALGELVEAYWPPLYAFARARGASSDDAADLVQSFFARVVEKGGIAPLERRARFRAFLVAAFQHHCANERDAAGAAKRGGEQRVLSIDELARAGEHDDRWHPRDGESPERIYERRYAHRVLERVLACLGEEQLALGKERQLAALAPHLTGDDDAATLAAIASELDTTEGALKVALHRLRKRYGELLRAEVARTLDDPEQVDDELRDLLAALAT